LGPAWPTVSAGADGDPAATFTQPTRMSRELRVQHLPARLASAAAIPADFVPRPLGPRTEVVAALRRVAPDLDDSDPACYRFEGPDGPVEVLIPPDDPCLGFTLRVGDGASVPFIVNDILTELGMHALDPAAPNGLFALPEGGLEGLTAWHEHRMRMAAARR
jgi:hypothetical protein